MTGTVNRSGGQPDLAQPRQVSSPSVIPQRGPQRTVVEVPARVTSPARTVGSSTLPSLQPPVVHTPLGARTVRSPEGASIREVSDPGTLASLGPVCKPSSSGSPATELFHHLKAGQPYVFVQGNQQLRTTLAACAATEAFRRDPTSGPVRLITWSSANGWLELYPESGQPVSRDAQGKVLSFRDATGGTPTAYNDANLVKEIYGPQDAGVVLDFLNPVATLRAIGGYELGDSESGQGRAVFVLNGMGPHLKISDNDDGRVLQQLRDMRHTFTTELSQKHIIFNDTADAFPLRAQELGSSFQMPLPSRENLEASAFGAVTNYLYSRVPADAPTCATEAVTQEQLSAWRAVVGETLSENLIRNSIADGITLDQFKAFFPEGESLRTLAESLLGFTLDQSADLVGEAISRGTENSPRQIDMAFVTRRRFEMLKENFHIELVSVDPDLPAPQGLERATARLKSIGAVFENGHLRKKPVSPPKLMLLAGVPGMGKSLLAKQAAQELGLPLIKLDLAKLFNKYVGQSEANFARVLEVLEALQPCVVWLDEVEKALGGTAEGTSSTDGGVTDRVHGLMLTWLEEHKARILMIGTCNEPQKLSSALVSRTSIKYFVGYQPPEQLAAIWKANLAALTDGFQMTDDELLALAELKPTMTGREVANLVRQAREIALFEAPTAEECITAAQLRPLVEEYTTDYEKAPEKAKAILAMSAAYEPASGGGIYIPPEPGDKPARTSAPAGSAAEPSGASSSSTRRPRAGASDPMSQV